MRIFYEIIFYNYRKFSLKKVCAYIMWTRYERGSGAFTQSQNFNHYKDMHLKRNQSIYGNALTIEKTLRTIVRAQCVTQCIALYIGSLIKRTFTVSIAFLYRDRPVTISSPSRSYSIEHRNSCVFKRSMTVLKLYITFFSVQTFRNYLK